MKKFFVIISLLIPLCSFRHHRINYSIEIYILKKVQTKLVDGVPGEFSFNKKDLPIIPFIRDDEIISFDTSAFKIEFDKAAAKRIGALKPGLQIGIPFVLVVDRQPVLTGYFCNIVSSFGCGTYVLINSTNQSQMLRKGMPEQLYLNTVPESRKSFFFIQALERTGRLK